VAPEETVLLDDAPEHREHSSQLVVVEVNRRHAQKPP
jgi:hypothetical protein